MKKNIVLIALVTIIIICVSALIILIAKGYKFNGRELTQTSIINVESEPKGAGIYINEEYKGTTPKQIQGLENGTYSIKIIKEGYSSWEKKVEVEKGIVTNLYPVLFSEQLELLQITDTIIDKIFFSSDGEVAVYVVSQEKQDENNGIWLLKLTKSLFSLGDATPEKIASISEIPTDNIANLNYSISIGPDNRSLLLRYDKKQDDKSIAQYRVINSHISPNESLNINTLLKFSPDVLKWGTRTDELIISEPQMISSYDLNTNEQKIIRYFKESIYNYNQNSETIVILESFEQEQDVFIYHKDNLREIDSQKIEALSNIENIITTNGADPILFIATEKGTYWYLTKEDKIKKISDQDSFPFSTSPANLSFLYTQNSQLKSLVFEESTVGLKDTTYQILKAYNTDQQMIKWHPESRLLVIYNKETEDLSFIESDGNNLTTIAEVTLNENGDYIVSADGNSIFLLVEERSEVDEKEIIERNIFKIDLKTDSSLSLF